MSKVFYEDENKYVVKSIALPTHNKSDLIKDGATLCEDVVCRIYLDAAPSKEFEDIAREKDGDMYAANCFYIEAIAGRDKPDEPWQTSNWFLFYVTDNGDSIFLDDSAELLEAWTYFQEEFNREIVVEDVEHTVCEWLNGFRKDGWHAVNNLDIDSADYEKMEGLVADLCKQIFPELHEAVWGQYPGNEDLIFRDKNDSEGYNLYYYNPDSNAGGQIVQCPFDLDDAPQMINNEDYMDVLAGHVQYLSDVDTEHFLNTIFELIELKQNGFYLGNDVSEVCRAIVNENKSVENIIDSAVGRSVEVEDNTIVSSKRFVVCVANNVDYNIRVSKAFNTREKALEVLQDWYEENKRNVEENLEEYSLENDVYKVSCFNDDLFYGRIVEIEVDLSLEKSLDNTLRNTGSHNNEKSNIGME